MNKLIEFYDEISSRKHLNNIRLHITHGPVTDWSIQIRVGKDGEYIFDEQHSDIDLLSAYAQIALKEWLLKHNDGY